MPVSVRGVSFAVPPRRACLLKLTVQLLDSLSVAPDDVTNMADAIEVQLEFVELAHDLVEARDLTVGSVDQISSLVILLHGNHGALFAEVFDTLLDLHHQAVEMP